MNHDELRHDISRLLSEIKRRRQLLVSPSELWGEPLDVGPQEQGYLAALLDLGDHRVCPVPAHAGEYRYIGAGRYVCEVCLKLAQEVV